MGGREGGVEEKGGLESPGQRRQHPRGGAIKGEKKGKKGRKGGRQGGREGGVKGEGKRPSTNRCVV